MISDANSIASPDLMTHILGRMCEVTAGLHSSDTRYVDEEGDNARIVYVCAFFSVLDTDDIAAPCQFVEIVLDGHIAIDEILDRDAFRCLSHARY